MTKLFSPVTYRGLTLKNRVIVAPMCQYSAQHGMANDWHLVHLGRFALGGFSLVIVEATGVTPEGRISYGCLGLWDDAQIAPLKRITDFLHANGAAAGIQLAHAGRKANSPLPWRGSFNETEAEKVALGFETWASVAPSAERHMASYPMPEALDAAGLARVRNGFVAATKRSDTAGFDMIELHSAHGYLLNQFLSPVANKRTDEYGGSLEKRMRYPLEVFAAIRAAWPKDKPIGIRVSAVDWVDGGTTIEDTIKFAQELKSLGCDYMDVSSGQLDSRQKIPFAPNFNVPFAEAVKKATGMPTMSVGLITNAREAEDMIAAGKTDMVALARGAMYDPRWPIHAAMEIGAEPPIVPRMTPAHPKLRPMIFPGYKPAA